MALPSSLQSTADLGGSLLLSPQMVPAGPAAGQVSAREQPPGVPKDFTFASNKQPLEKLRIGVDSFPQEESPP